MNNPLVAERQDSTQSYTGIGPIEAAVDLQQAFASGTWLDQGLALAGGGLEALAFVLDPLGSLIATAVSWIIEHVGPLREALDWLAGDADQIAAYAKTWGNVSQAVTRANETLVNEVGRGAAGWTGASADAYRASITGQSRHITAAARCAEIIGTAVEVSGVLVGTVRAIVREIIAECVATLIARIPQWLLEEAVTLGFATAHVVAAAVAVIANFVKKIGDKIAQLLRSIAKLRPLLSRLDEIWELIKQGLKALRKGDAPGGAPKAPDPVKKPGNTDVKPQGDPGGTTTPAKQGGDPPVSKPPQTQGDNGSTPPPRQGGEAPPVAKPPQPHGGDPGGTTTTSGTTGGTTDAPTRPTGGDTTPAGGGSGSNPPTDGSGGGANKPPGDTTPPPTPGDPNPHPLGRRPIDPRQPHPELTPAEKAALDKHVRELEAKNPERFKELEKDPDHNGKPREAARDEARLALDLEGRGYGPFERPTGPDGKLLPKHGDFVDASGQLWDAKSINSDWPPGVPADIRKNPYTNGYTEAWLERTVEDQFTKQRNVILDTRNANAADIESVRALVERKGWGDRIIFYP
ncbi:hypothetical protein ABZ816_27160 [Actinosynnema sp. NPDC047251]|uniref:Uncharacterized protein n=1 Tax=Saccharothrix espanaensis (strain ATCC 51144 / DSM 44229 / JCM 9112 / NBRC 15066 / NRRL 15764) TaxID=1179773 RepID=K0JV83_SACES|nr:hypothetical protein [Saccharothrix espanaensis]CCH28679.1 hypothetical protein BN6_13530 [Saccharothrix espanaensis DSM 44229]